MRPVGEHKPPRTPLAPQVKTYTEKAGDPLWKIGQQSNGNASQCPKIIAGTPGRLKDDKTVIHPGDVLLIPEESSTTAAARERGETE